MFTKADVIATITQESEIIKHLASKVTTQEHLAYRPNDKQRSMHELLAYMSRMTTMLLTMIKNKKMDPELTKTLTKESEAKNMLTDFNASMDTQLAFVTEYINNISDEELKASFDLFNTGKVMSTKSYFMMVFRQYPVYRMQLFNYLKSGLGMKELNTMNLWMGQNTPQK